MLFWPLCCLFFFDIRILIGPPVSSTSSCWLGIRLGCSNQSVMSTHELLFYKNPTKRIGLVQSGHRHHRLIELNVFSP